MEVNKSDIIEKATQLIIKLGLEALTIDNLATELGINKDQVYNKFSNVDDILFVLLQNFETELKELVLESSNTLEAPEIELKQLFKKFYYLFLQKPYYLSIIFDKSLFVRENRIKMSLLQIKNVMETYLTSLINTGKLSQAFKSKVPTKLIVDKILSEFRLLMKDEQHVNEMVLQLIAIKTIKDSKDDEVYNQSAYTNKEREHKEKDFDRVDCPNYSILWAKSNIVARTMYRHCTGIQ